MGLGSSEKQARAVALFRTASKTSSLRPSALLEIAALCAGVKPSLRLVLNPEDSDMIAAAVEKAGLQSAVRGARVQHEGGTWSSLVEGGGGERVSVVAISESPSAASEVLAAEFSDPELAGRLLGYPQCCVLALPRLSEAGGRWPFALLQDRASPLPIDARLNRFAAEWGGIGLLGEMFPCSLECTAAAEYAGRIHSATVEMGLIKLAGRAVEDALQPVVIDRHGSARPANDTDVDAVRFRW